jgi:hypothetical protein
LVQQFCDIFNEIGFIRLEYDAVAVVFATIPLAADLLGILQGFAEEVLNTLWPEVWSGLSVLFCDKVKEVYDEAAVAVCVTFDSCDVHGETMIT